MTVAVAVAGWERCGRGVQGVGIRVRVELGLGTLLSLGLELGVRVRHIVDITVTVTLIVRVSSLLVSGLGLRLGLRRVWLR